MVQYIRTDLDFILEQILIAERNAAGEALVDILPNAEVPFGLRTVTGEFNNLIAGQDQFGAADNTFPRLADPLFRTDPNYADPGNVVDPAPRTISNLIVDQTANNPAAVAAAADNPFSAIDFESRSRRHPRHRGRPTSLLHPEHDTGCRPVCAVQCVDDILRPVLRSRP